ncbi:hypothetical protein B0H14DRAFT_3156586 [Mycena olivaceomarginata]|nr:hypothetical protein B0H14DRAFT_3156586 [Mycena olivaceomarginata]
MRNILANIQESQYTVNATTFEHLWDEVVIDMFGTWVSIFLYAFYLNLFFFAIYTLGRRKTAGKKVLLGFTWATAVLGTTQMALRLGSSVLGVRALLQLIEQTTSIRALEVAGTLRFTQPVIFAINNLVTDTLLLYRCYMIWGSRWKVVAVPGCLVVATFVIGCVSAASFNLSYSSSFGRLPYILATVTNLVLMLFTAGRIWWIRRDIMHMNLNQRIRDCYSRVIAMILESGAIYCIFTIVLATTVQLGIFVILEAAAIHLVNIMPVC